MSPEPMPSPRCLWIDRYVPYPIDEGFKLYAAKLSSALADAGAYVRALGFGDSAAVPRDVAVHWQSVATRGRRPALSLFSRLPLAAALDATPSYRAMLRGELRERWDAIVFDSYASGWALPIVQAHYARTRQPRPVLVHVSHNHETALWRGMAKDARSPLLKRAVLWQNYRKVRALERKLSNQTDLLTAITEEDARALRSHSSAERSITLTPGYDGYKCTERLISANTPRRVVIVGSFRWVVKRENLIRFIEAADSTFADNGIDLQIMGEVPSDLRDALAARCRATKFLGFQPSLAKVFDHARIAVVPELIGGGFKLKFLDYLFGRVPVAAVDAATSGLPSAVREHMLVASDYASLTRSIVEYINRFDDLNRMQAHAFSAADRLFDWDDRGTQLLNAICAARSDRVRVNAPVRLNVPIDQVSA